MHMLDPQNTLSIALTEPVVFLRSSDPSGRLETYLDDSPTLVRGILTLNVVKAIDISSIEAELTGVLTISEPDGFAAGEVEIPGKRKIYSSSVTVFRARQSPHIRPASTGPGLSPASASYESDRAGRAFSPLSSSRRRHSERFSAVTDPIDLGPTPPYTPVAPPPTPIQQRLESSGENAAQTLEEPRQAARCNLECRVYQNGPDAHYCCPNSAAFSLANPMMHSGVAETSNTPFQESDDRSGEMTCGSPPFEDGLSAHNIVGESSYILHHRVSSSAAHSDGNTQSHIHIHDSSDGSASFSRLRLSLNSVFDTVSEIASRPSSRSQGASGLEETERGRTRARITYEQQRNENILEAREGIIGTGSGLGVDTSHPTSGGEHREHHLFGLGGFLGLERINNNEGSGTQKSKTSGGRRGEFHLGTYSYPISFLLPPNLPPTYSVPYASLKYVIKGVAHRMGTFRSKLSCKAPLLVIASPTTGAGEGAGTGDLRPLFIEKQWEEKLAYHIELSSRLFVLGSKRHLEVAANESTRTSTESQVEAEMEARAGAAYGTAVLDLTLLPLEKVKIWKLSIIVDQRIRYVDEKGNLFRADHHKRVKLLEVQDTCSAEEMDLAEEQPSHKNKHRQKQDPVQIPLLPTPVSPHRSPLLPYISPISDASILAGPGPYTLSISIGLPHCNDSSSDGNELHFTVKHKSSEVKVEHFLRLVLRAQLVAEKDTDGHEGRDPKKMVDIVVQTPITILSCRCVPECQTLPRYSQMSENNSQHLVTCPCRPNLAGPTGQGHGGDADNQPLLAITSSASSFETGDGVRHFHYQADEQHGGSKTSRSSSGALGSDHQSTSTMPLHSHSPFFNRTREGGGSRHGQSHSYNQLHHSLSTSQVRTHSQTRPLTPPLSRSSSPLVRYERLVSGLESEDGEAPPSYESISPSS